MIEIIPSFEDFFENYENKKAYKFDDYKGIVKYTGKYNQLKGLSKPKAPIPIIDDLNLRITQYNRQYIYTYSFCGESEEYKVYSSQNLLRHFQKKDVFINDIDDSIKRLFVDYFNYLTQFLNNNISKIKKNGWVDEYDSHNYQPSYLMVEKTEYGHYTIFPNKRNIESDSLNHLIKAMICSPNLAIMLAYGLHSVSKYLFVNYDTLLHYYSKSDTEDYWKPFSLCLYGQPSTFKELTKKQLAAIFLDYIKQDNDSKTINIYHKPHFTLGKLDSKLQDLCVLGDLPIIITGSGNTSNISSNSAAIKKIEQLQLNGFFKGSPVFISNTPIKRDSILNINISNIGNIDIEETRTCIHTLLFEFIHYLYEESNEDLYLNTESTFKQYKPCYYLKNIAPQEAEQHFPAEHCYPYYRFGCIELLTALKRFECFIYLKYPKFYTEFSKLITILQPELMTLALDCEYAHANPAETSDTQVKTYEKMFFNILQHQYNTHNNSIRKTSDEYYVEYEIFNSIGADLLQKTNSINTTCKKILSYCRNTMPPLIKPNYKDANKKIFREVYFIRKKKKVLIIPTDIFEQHISLASQND